MNILYTNKFLSNVNKINMVGYILSPVYENPNNLPLVYDINKVDIKLTGFFDTIQKWIKYVKSSNSLCVFNEEFSQEYIINCLDIVSASFPESKIYNLGYVYYIEFKLIQVISDIKLKGTNTTNTSELLLKVFKNYLFELNDVIKELENTLL